MYRRWMEVAAVAVALPLLGLQISNVSFLTCLCPARELKGRTSITQGAQAKDGREGNRRSTCEKQDRCSDRAPPRRSTTQHCITQLAITAGGSQHTATFCRRSLPLEPRLLLESTRKLPVCVPANYCFSIAGGLAILSSTMFSGSTEARLALHSPLMSLLQP